MTIGQYSTNYSAGAASGGDDVMAEANMSMMRNALDQVEMQGEQIASMIQATAVLPPMDGTGGNIDILV